MVFDAPATELKYTYITDYRYKVILAVDVVYFCVQLKKMCVLSMV